VAGTKSFLAKPGQIEEKWRVIDATDQVVGRLASKIAMMLMGKHRPTYTPHVLCGDAVIVINAEKVRFTGKKWTNKEYAWFTGYTGLRKESAQRRLERHPDRILRDAVRRMLPKNKLAFKMIQRLKIYPGADHPHQAQQAEKLELAAKK
jgi:large subunit ribosomal protein L13